MNTPETPNDDADDALLALLEQMHRMLAMSLTMQAALARLVLDPTNLQTRGQLERITHSAATFVAALTAPQPRTPS